jgi:2-(1,2-epoxy-1,2-dihydrophenyl)acetyl-CoA isomerase
LVLFLQKKNCFLSGVFLMELLTEIDGPIARITFNRPQARNALTAGMVSAMAAFLGQIEHDPEVRCVVLTGAGEHFMAGGDVAGFASAVEAPPAEREADFVRRASGAIPVFEVFERLSQPIIAKVRGAVAGASISWVAAADFVLLSDTALFVFAHILLGTTPDGALSYTLPRAVGLRRAKELIMLGGRLNAQEALAAGLANRIVPNAELDAQTEALAQKLAHGPSFAIGRSKRLLNGSLEHTQREQMVLEAEAFGACAATADFVEGVSAFMGKRKAVFRGA